MDSRLIRTGTSAKGRGLLFSLSMAVVALGCDAKEKPLAPGAAADQGKAADAGKAADPAKAGGAEAKPSAQALREKMATLPSADVVAKVVNPTGRAPYAGPVGKIVGHIRRSGDEALVAASVLKKIEAGCDGAKEMYGAVFREGKDRLLADVLVAATEYDGFVASSATETVVGAKGCAYTSRTVAMTFGQDLVVEGLDRHPYVPQLLGQVMPAQLFVLPTSPRVSIPPQKPGQYQLIDSMRLYAVADVFVLPYPTFDVTELDGKFEISGVPVGKVKVNALLPQTMATVGGEVVVKAGETVTLDLELPFDQAEFKKRTAQ